MSEEPRGSWRRAEIGVVAVCLLVYGVICWPLARGELYGSKDLVYEHLARRASYALSLERGERGFWFPYLHRGESALFHGEGGICHPLRYLECRLLDPVTGMALEIALLYPVVFGGMYWFLRRRECSAGASALGAGVFMLSPYFVAHQGQINHVWILAHTPFAALAMDGVLRGRRPALAAGALALLVASMLLLGHPQMVWLAGLTTGMVAVLDGAAVGWRRGWWRRLAVAAAAAGCGVLIGAIQLWPSVHGLAESPRGTLTAQERENFSLHPWHLAANAAPYLTRATTVGDWFYLKEGRDFLNNPSEFTVYFGLALLTFLWAATVLWAGPLVQRCGRAGLLIGIGGSLVFLLLAMGQYGGLNEVLGRVPLLSQFRCPNRYKEVLAFLVALAAARCLDVTATRPAPARRWVVAAAAAPLLLCGGLFLYSLGAAGLSRQAAVYHWAPWPLRLVGPALCLMVLGLVWWLSRERSWAWLALGVVIVLDLGVHGLTVMRDVTFRNQAELRAAIAKMAAGGQVYRFVADEQSRILEGQLQANGYSGMPPAEPLDFGNRQHLRLASVAAAHAQQQQPDGRSVVLSRTLDDALPRYRLATRVEHAAAPLADLAGCELTTTVRCTPEVTPPLDGPPLTATEAAVLAHDEADVLRFAVHTEHERMLVVSDRWTPDWRATVDGQAQTLLPLFAGAIRGIRLPPGDHQVEIVYDPPIYYRARRVCWAGLVLTGLLVLGVHRAGRWFEG